MTDGIVTTRRLDGLPNVVNEGDESKLGDWEYAPVQGGTFLHAGVYSMRKAGKELTKTRGVDPKRVSPNEAAGRLLVERALEAMEKEYHPEIPIAIFLPIRDLVTIGQALTSCENNREMWAAGLAGRWAPPIDSPNALHRAINLEKLGQSGVGYRGARMTGKRSDGRTGHCGSPIGALPSFRLFPLKIRNRKARGQRCISPTGLIRN
jgi:hypothetical protein